MPTITVVKDPPGYFQVASTGTIHLIRKLVKVGWGSGTPSHTSVTFWCSNIARGDHGQLSSNKPRGGSDCLRCADALAGRRVRRPKRPPTPWRALPWP